MNSFRRALTVLTVVLTIGMLMGCQNSVLEPEPTTQENLQQTVQLIPASNQALGLAKGEIAITKDVDAEEGITLGGERTGGNAVIIPAGALAQDMVLTFTLKINDEGALVFAVSRADSDEDGHIYFQDGKTSSLVVNEKCLAQHPDAAMNVDSGEIFPATRQGESFRVDLPHFSSYAWIIME